MEKGLGLLSGLFAVLGGGALAVLTGITVVSVFYRYILRDPIFGIEDMSTMTLTVVAAAGIAWGAGNRGHISVNVLALVTGRKLTRWTDLVERGLTAAMLGFAAFALARKGGCGMDCGALTANLSIVHTPYYYTLAAALGLFCAYVLLHLLIGLAHWNGVDPNEVPD